MSEIVWSQHPSMRSRVGTIAVWSAVAIVLMASRWWVPALLAKVTVLEAARPWLDATTQWSWLALALPFLAVIAAWIATRLVRYDLTNDRLLISQGLLLRRMDNLELYRIRDLHVELPLWSRILGVGDIVLNTVDQTNPVVILRGIKQPVEAFDRIRTFTENSRRKAGIAGVT